MERMRGMLRSDDVEAKIRGDIADGVYAPGDRLPGPGELAEELGKLTKAVEAAYRRLVEDGLLVEGIVEPGFLVADPGLDPDVRAAMRAVRSAQLRMEALERRSAELTERLESVERRLRESGCRCQGGHPY
ncbi:GntR family transcriptional regulator [Streptomyces sp. NPDC018031]|uniref:GntR family transcriptional regulator n=1 Tax=Streptomyces sp. NPDC018031 TaxID=3365033 RepID=UPI00378E4E05